MINDDGNNNENDLNDNNSITHYVDDFTTYLYIADIAVEFEFSKWIQWLPKL